MNIRLKWYRNRHSFANATGCHRAAAAGKDVVIDAKMTLVAYERYFNLKMTTHVKARYRNISRRCVTYPFAGTQRLSTAAGAANSGYVLMFIPVEPAFLLALDRQPS